MKRDLGAPDGIWYDLKDKKSVGIIGEDPELKLKYVASPKGILASVAPTTNPNVTIIFNGTYAIKGRNVLIVAPHPRAIKTSLRTCEIMNDALKMEGAPDNLIQCIEETVYRTHSGTYEKQQCDYCYRRCRNGTVCIFQWAPCI